MYVSLLSLNGMCDARSVRDLIHLPRAVSEELIARASCMPTPDTLDLETRSDPAKSAMYNLEELCTACTQSSGMYTEVSWQLCGLVKPLLLQ